MSKINHRIHACTSCRHQGATCLAGHRLIRSLENALNLAGSLVGEDFEISGKVGLSNCARPCTAAFKASRRAIHFFGDVDPEADIEDLVRLSERHQGEGEGETRGRCGLAIAR